MSEYFAKSQRFVALFSQNPAGLRSIQSATRLIRLYALPLIWLAVRVIAMIPVAAAFLSVNG
jgi:hypothetical protein